MSWKNEPDRHAMSSKGIKTVTKHMKCKGKSNVITLVSDTGFGINKVETREGKDKYGNDVIQFRKGSTTKGKRWKSSKFKSIEEAVIYLRNDSYVSPEQLEEWQSTLHYESSEINSKSNKELNEVRNEIKMLENEMKNKKINSLSKEDQEKYWDLCDKRKELEGIENRKHEEKIRERKELEEKWLEEHIEKIEKGEY